MSTRTAVADLPVLSATGRVPRSIRSGTVVDRWDCPACDRTIDIVHRPGRPRLYCSHACRQRAYRWRRRHGAHTLATPEWPAEHGGVDSSADQASHSHALRDPRDPLARRRDRRGRQATVCGLMARSRSAPGSPFKAPFLASSERACTTCRTLIQPREGGLVVGPAPPIPGAGRPLQRGEADPAIAALHHIDPAWPLRPEIRDLLQGLWSLAPTSPPR